MRDEMVFVVLNSREPSRARQLLRGQEVLAGLCLHRAKPGAGCLLTPRSPEQRGSHPGALGPRVTAAIALDMLCPWHLSQSFVFLLIPCIVNHHVGAGN